MIKQFASLKYLSVSLTCLVILAACSSTSKLPAKGPSVEESQSVSRIQTGPELALDLLLSSASHVENLKAFRFQIHAVRDEVFSSGRRLQFEQNTTITVKRPDSIQASTRGDLDGSDFYLYGRTAVLHDSEKQLYSSYPVPGGIDASLNNLVERHGFSIPLAELVFNDITGPVTASIRKARYVGLHSVSGIPCHHLYFKGEQISWQLWIASEGDPWPLKVVVSYLNEKGVPQYSAVLSDWQEQENIPDSLFNFVPSEGTERISGLTNAK